MIVWGRGVPGVPAAAPANADPYPSGSSPWSVTTNNAAQGIASSGRQVWLAGSDSGSEGYISRYAVVGDAYSRDAIVRVSEDAAFSGFTGAPHHHWGDIDHGGGYLWGLVGAAATVAWLARIDPVTLEVDAAWDLNDELGALHSSGDPVAYAGTDGADTLVWYCTPARLFELRISDADVVSEDASHGVTIVQGALLDWGFPQGLAVLDGGEFALGLYAASGWDGPVDGVWVCRFDSSGKIRPVQGWETSEPSAHVQGIDVLSYADGALDVLHAETSQVARYEFPQTAQHAVREYLSTRGLTRWHPLEWNALDYAGEASTPSKGANVTHITINLPAGSGVLGAAQYDGGATTASWHQGGYSWVSNAADPAAQWAFGIWFRIYAVSGGVNPNLAQVGKANSGSPNYDDSMLLRTLGGAWAATCGDSANYASAVLTPDGGAGAVNDGEWHLGVVQHEGDGEFRAWLASATGVEEGTFSVASFLGISVASGSQWRIGSAANASVANHEGALWGHFVLEDDNLTTEDVEALWALAGGAS